MFYPIVYGLVAIPMPEQIQPNTRVSKYCHSMAFRQVHTSADYYKCSFYPLAVVQLNAVPEWVVCLPNLDAFKEAVGKLHHSRPYKSCHDWQRTHMPAKAYDSIIIKKERNCRAEMTWNWLRFLVRPRWLFPLF